MTKLTVAEASKRGYASGLSILQAVQKDWLKAEKGEDGQLHVDTDDLVKLFGRPDGSGQALDETPSPLSHAGDSAAAEARRPVPPDDIEDFDAFEETDAVDFPVTEDEDDMPARTESASVAHDDQTAGQLSDASAISVAPQPPPPATDQTETDDRAALRAEITELRHALAAEKRRTAALVDVLATRVLAPDDDDRITPSDGDDASAHSDAKSADRETAVDTPPAAGTADTRTDRPEDGQSGPAVPPEAAPFPEHDDDQVEGDDIAMPALSADPAERRLAPATPPSRLEAKKAEHDRALFWQVWCLMSFVWVGLIGAILWYIGGLGDDLWTMAEWLRGARAGDSPAFIDASSASLRAARDVFVPPLALLVLMLMGRKIYRALRRH